MTTDNKALADEMREQANEADFSGWGAQIRAWAAQVEALTREPSQQFDSAEALADWLDSLRESTDDGAVTNRKWEPAQRAAAAIREPSTPSAQVSGGGEMPPHQNTVWVMLRDENREMPAAKPYYTAEQMRAALSTPQARPDGDASAQEMSPEFTDSARAALAWVLYHHQGGSSPVGQPIRFALGMGAHERMGDWRIAEAKRWAESTGRSTADFHATPRVSGGGEAAALPKKWRDEAAFDGYMTGVPKIDEATANRASAKCECADELEAVLSTPQARPYCPCMKEDCPKCYSQARPDGGEAVLWANPLGGTISPDEYAILKAANGASDWRPLIYGDTHPTPAPDFARLVELLEAAVCPMKASGCDGTQYPAGDPHGDYYGEQCQWCYERREALAPFTAQPESRHE